MILGLGNIKINSSSPLSEFFYISVTMETLYLAIDKHENEHEKSSMRVIHEPDFKSSHEISITASIFANRFSTTIRRGSLDTITRRPSAILTTRSRDVLFVKVTSTISSIFVDLVKISEYQDFFDSDIKPRFVSIISADSPPKQKKAGGLADLSVSFELIGEKTSIAVCGEDFGNNVMTTCDSYKLKATLESEVSIYFM